MELRRARIGDVDALMVGGDVDLAAVPRFTDALARLTGDAPGRTVAVDLDGVGLIDDAALGLILGAAGRSRSHGGDLVVVCTEARLRARLTENGFDRAVRVGSTIAGA